MLWVPCPSVCFGTRSRGASRPLSRGVAASQGGIVKKLPCGDCDSGVGVE